MFKLNAVHYFFLFCTALVAIGETHRVLDKPSVPSEEPERKPIPEKILGNNKPDFIFPIHGKSRKDLIGVFGEPRGGGARKHEGIDIAAKRGTPVVAVADGVVSKVKEGGNGGKQVWMEDATGEFTFFYAHLNSQSVRPGQKVKQGDELGTVGNTGNASAGSPHLHFEILMGGRKAVDPLGVLP